MRIIRILHIVTKMDAAGIETFLMNIYRNIDRSRVQFDFLTHRSEEGFYDQEILRLGGRIFNIPPINPFKHRTYIRMLDIFFKENKYKIVHSHINTFSMYPLRAAMRAGVPIRIAHSHIANVPFNIKFPFRMYARSRLKEFSIYNFACSEAAGKWLFGSNTINNDNFRVIHNAIDAQKYVFNEKVRNKIRSEFELENKIVIGHVGRFSKQKNHEFLIDLFYNVHENVPNAVLILIGDGKLKNSIKSKVNDLGLQDKVIFAGVRSNIHELLQAMDVFIFPSLYEGLGIALIEAQAAGLRCIVTERIPREAYITELVHCVPLNQGLEKWSKKVIAFFEGYSRTNTFELIKESGFNIDETAEDMQAFYQNVYDM